jgi:4-hydroxy-tetrahydrodipicolinate synthase
MIELKGVCVPICTPFTEGGANVDEKALRNHIDSMIEADVHIICVNGGTGEFPFLSETEKRRVLEIAVKHIAERCKIIAHVSCVRTEDTIEAGKHAEDCGADAIMVLPPYFEGPDVEGVMWHYDNVSQAVELPIMAYNIPQCSDFDITPAIFQRLLQIENVRYIKESTSIMLRIEDLVAQGARVFCGCDFLMLYALMTGASGCFWGGANVIPAQAVQLYNLHSAGKFSESLDLWHKIQPLNRLFWTIPFNPAVKEATNLSGRPVAECRLPVQPLSREHKETVRDVYAKVTKQLFLDGES